MSGQAGAWNGKESRGLPGVQEVGECSFLPETAPGTGRRHPYSRLRVWDLSYDLGSQALFSNKSFI